MEQIVKTNVGLDISMETYWATITLLNSDHEIKHVKSKEFGNNEKGFKEMEQWIAQAKIETKEFHFTMEATGVYYENIANYLYEQKHLVHVVLPNKAKKFAESLDIKSKTDKLDSKALGRFGAERKFINWKPAAPIYKELKSLTRERGSYVKIRSQLKNQRHALKHSFQPNESTIIRLDTIISVLDTNVKEIEKEISVTIKKDTELSAKMDILTSIPGIGETTAATTVAETNGFSLIVNIRQLTSYAGYDVQLRESGKWKGKSKISKKGNSHIRAALYFPALTTIKYSEQHKTFYDRILGEKEKSKIAITAVSRKLLVLMYTLWKTNTKYQENYETKKAEQKAEQKVA